MGMSLFLKLLALLGCFLVIYAFWTGTAGMAMAALISPGALNITPQVIGFAPSEAVDHGITGET